MSKLAVMAGAEWNLLDESGSRVALCNSNDLLGDATPEDIQRARRLAACWNLCQGISTEDIENGKVVVVSATAVEEYFAARTALMERIGSPVRCGKKTAMARYATAEERLRMTLEAALSRIQQKPSGGE